MSAINALTVDVEDYFHVEAFASRIPTEQWNDYPPRVEINVDRILSLFDRNNVHGTFFMLGWVAKKFPDLVRRIAQAGHEIGCHGFGHQHLRRLSPHSFRADIGDARKRLMDEIQQPVICYRAPCFSIMKQTSWAFDILAEEGFVLDSSVFPVRHDVYGIPEATRFPQWYRTSRGNAIFEFPPSTIRYWKNNWAVAGGGYLRLLPYGVTEWALRRINQREGQPAMVYFHPWELDPDQPRISAGWRSRFRHYTRLDTTETKLERLIQNFSFSTFSMSCKQLKTYQAREMKPWLF